MALFNYKAILSDGKKKKGFIEAESERAARTKLKAEGLFISEIYASDKKESSNIFSKDINLTSNRVSTTDLAVATRQLSTLISAGMPLADGLKSLTEQIENQALKNAIAKIATNVNEGGSLAGSLGEHAKIFPKLYINMVASGEASGTLDLVLTRLADLLESQARLSRKVISSLAYPVLMAFLSVIVIFLLMIYVIPQITKIFKDQNATLPLATKIVISISNFATHYWYIVGAFFILSLFLIKTYRNTPKGRATTDRLLLKLPIVGSLSLKIACSRLSRNLSTLLSSGVNLLTSLEIVKNILNNVILEQALEQSATGVREGRSLAKELKDKKVFPPLLVQMVAIGEKSGDLDSMLNRAAISYENEVESFLSAITSILEPVMIVVMALIIGSILASVMLPMLQMTNMIGVR